MYTVDDKDSVVELSKTPRPNVGAPLPVVLADDYRLLLAYLMSNPDPKWDGSYINIVDAESDGRAIALIRFHNPYAHMFGPPNDEAFSGHPLARRGLKPYSVFEVRESSWIRQLERMNSVHPYHNPDWFLKRMKHFVFAFHDSTFECIADGFELQQINGSLLSALAEMTKLLKEDPV